MWPASDTSARLPERTPPTASTSRMMPERAMTIVSWRPCTALASRAPCSPLIGPRRAPPAADSGACAEAGAARRAPADAQRRGPLAGAPDRHVLPPDAAGPAGADRLEVGFFGGEAGGVVEVASGAALAVAGLGLVEDAAHEPGARHRPPQTPGIAEIEPDSQDHAHGVS